MAYSPVVCFEPTLPYMSLSFPVYNLGPLQEASRDFVKLYESDSCEASCELEGTGIVMSPPHWQRFDINSAKSPFAQIRCV